MRPTHVLFLSLLLALGCVSPPAEVEAYVCEGKAVPKDLMVGVDSFYVSTSGDVYVVFKPSGNESNASSFLSEALILNESGKPHVYFKVPPGIWVDAREVLKDQYNESEVEKSWKDAVNYASTVCPKENVKKALFEKR